MTDTAQHQKLSRQQMLALAIEFLRDKESPVWLENGGQTIFTREDGHTVSYLIDHANPEAHFYVTLDWTERGLDAEEFQFAASPGSEMFQLISATVEQAMRESVDRLKELRRRLNDGPDPAPGV